MIDRAIIMLTDHSGAVLLAPHRQVTRSIIGTPMAPAAASYRASGLVHWRKADIDPVMVDVRDRGKAECAGRPARSRWCKSITMKE
jgi:hypothetical protein